MDSIAVTSSGHLRGTTTDGITAYLGIPYAADPAGPKAFQAPEPAPAWDGVRDATALGATAPQPPYERPYDVLLTNPLTPGAAFLNLNVWTPGGSGLPVLVWLHGGAFRNGSNATPAYDGTAFARDGVILVSVNYRLGVQGFGVIEDAPSNRGLLDQLAALRWVQDNIAAFGGDPGRVTIAGQSAGGMSVATLMSIPSAQGLFQRAIVQSGSAAATALAADGAVVTAEVAKRLGVASSVAGFSGVAIDDLIAAQRVVALELRQNPDPARWGATVISAGGGIMPFFPVIDGELIHERPIDAIAAGAAAGVDLLTGATTEEMRLFSIPSGMAAAITAEALPVLLGQQGVPPAIVAAYVANRPGLTPGEVFGDIVGDTFFTLPTLRLAAAQRRHATAYLYEFDWKSPLAGLGACHALELPFVFDTLATATSPLYGEAPPQRVADQMHAAWVAFATTGRPGWPPYDATTRPVMTFTHPDSLLVEDPRAAELALWGHPTSD
ncbi:carboxylesterase/lipase family protein [Kribbella sp. CA-293567]|uniref:carboxylesterase/lipase family protein n=1 Tax=Kribbella sp. CA-293567 TaxID=3002436 RepID=UPI0022DDDCD9|nr:carboxylesterase family protein [Kribbella sp. CA-293567]WBQ02666.1 carboxylesterase family protein [Kribbella sp. CA-293567]